MDEETGELAPASEVWSAVHGAGDEESGFHDDESLRIYVSIVYTFFLLILLLSILICKHCLYFFIYPFFIYSYIIEIFLLIS